MPGAIDCYTGGGNCRMQDAAMNCTDFLRGNPIQLPARPNR